MADQLQTQSLLQTAPVESAKANSFEHLKRPAEEVNDEDTLRLHMPSKVNLIQTPALGDPDNEATVNNTAVFKKMPSRSQVQHPQASKPVSEISFSHCLPSARDKFSLLLPGFMAVRLSTQLAHMLEVAKKVDDMLHYQRVFRNKRSELFREIRSNILSNSKFYVDLEVLQKILYLLPEYYTFSRQKLEENRNRINIKYDIRFGVPANNQQPTERRNQLRKAIFQYICKKHAEYAQSKGIPVPEHSEADNIAWVEGFDLMSLDVPQYKFAFETEPEPIYQSTHSVSNRPLFKRSTSERSISVASLNSRKGFTEKLNAFSVLDKSTTESFKEKLYRLIAEKEKAYKEEKAKEEEVNKALPVQRGPSSEDCLVLLNQINMLYLQRGLSNMFVMNVVEQLQKRMSTYSRTNIEEMLERVLKAGQGYLQKVDNSKGVILKMEKSLFGKAKSNLEEKMKKEQELDEKREQLLQQEKIATQ